jgi:ABC-type microcin C transport system duplicated ATPase subunit YejF
MEQYLELQIRDARTGQLVHVSQTHRRGETDESWSRALKFLVRYELVEPELRRRDYPGRGAAPGQ